MGYNETKPTEKGVVMPSRLAYKITEDYTDMIKGFFGTDATILEGTYFLIEMTGPAEVNLKIVTEDQMFEEFKKDPALHIFT
jgi:hypothetical protein